MAPDAPVDAIVSCQELQERFDTIIEGVDRSCDVDDDCIRVGGGAGSATDCDCAAFVAGSCDGEFVRATAFVAVADQVAMLEQEFDARCRRECQWVPCICDCWAPAPVCVDNQCRPSFGPFCNPPPPPPDAAVDASLDASPSP